MPRWHICLHPSATGLAFAGSAGVPLDQYTLALLLYLEAISRADHEPGSCARLRLLVLSVSMAAMPSDSSCSSLGAAICRGPSKGIYPKPLTLSPKP